MGGWGKGATAGEVFPGQKLARVEHLRDSDVEHVLDLGFRVEGRARMPALESARQRRMLAIMHMSINGQKPTWPIKHGTTLIPQLDRTPLGS